MKKIISILLTLALMVNFLSVSAFASGLIPDGLSDVSNNARAMLDSAVDPMSHLSEGIDRLCQDLDNRLALAESFSAFKGIMTGLQTISLGLGLVNGTVSFLKLIGLLKDPTSMKLDTIIDMLADVQETVHTIDERTEDIQKSLITQASTTTYNFRLNRYDSYQQSWNNFFSSTGPYSEMNRLMNAYQSEFTKKMIEYTECWQKSVGAPVRVLYSEDGMPLVSGQNMNSPSQPLPYEPMYSDDNIRVASSATLPSNYIIVDKYLVNAESFMSLLTDAITRGTRLALDAKAVIFTDETFYDTYETLSEPEKAAAAENLSKCFLDAIAYDAAYETANMTYGVGTFANAVNSAFTAFSDTILGANSVTSPVESGMTKLSLTHAFESEIKDEAAVICAYISELGITYGQFTAFIVAMDKSFSAQNRDRLIDRTVDTAYYPICYHDSFITGYDNYCYPLNSLIAYNEVYYRGAYDINDGKLYDPKELKWEIRNENSLFVTTDGKEILDNNKMLSKEDMTLLYLYYQSAAAENSEYTQFNDYIESTGIMPPRTYEEERYDLFGRKTTKTHRFKPSAYYLMSNPSGYDLLKRKKAEYKTIDKTWGSTAMFYDNLVSFGPGEFDYTKQTEASVLFHDQLRGDVFDTTPGFGSLNDRLRNEMVLAERAYTYYYLDKTYGTGSKYVYVVFADPASYLNYAWMGRDDNDDSSLTIVSRDYSILSYSNTNVRGDGTGSIFSNGDLAIIGGSTLILTGGIVTSAFFFNNKKKKKEETEPETV